MATIEMIESDVKNKFEEMIRGFGDAELQAQDLVQQGAVHAISYLLTKNCAESVALDMLESLRKNAKVIRMEATRRGKPSLFSSDATYFN